MHVRGYDFPFMVWSQTILECVGLCLVLWLTRSANEGHKLDVVRPWFSVGSPTLYS